MGGFSNFAISFTIISILSGTLTLYGTGLNYGGPVEEAYGWPIVSVFVIIVGLGMAEIASKYPTAGGLYYWASKMGGPAWGWFTGWFNLIGQIAITAGIDYGAATFTDALLQLLWPGSFHGTQHEIVAVYAVILALHAIMNIFSVKLVALLNDISVWWHVAGVVIIVGFLIFKPDHHQSFGYVFGHTINNSGFGHSWLWFVLLLGLLQAQYTFTGYDASAHMSEETHDASRSAARGVIMSIVVSAVFGYILALGVTFAIQDQAATTKARRLRGEASVPRLTRVGRCEVRALHLRRRAVLLRHVVDHVGVADDVRVLARRRGSRSSALAPAEPRACAVPGSDRDRGARVPVRVPGVLRDERRRRIRRGDVDRDDRALHRLRDPDLPAAPAGRRVGAGRMEPRQALQVDRVDRRASGSRSSAILFILPTSPGGVPWRNEFTWLLFNYAIIAVVGTMLLVGGWWLLSARKWFTGPIVQGTPEELAAREAQYERRQRRAARPPRRRIV